MCSMMIHKQKPFCCFKNKVTCTHLTQKFNSLWSLSIWLFFFAIRIKFCEKAFRGSDPGIKKTRERSFRFRSPESPGRKRHFRVFAVERKTAFLDGESCDFLYSVLHIVKDLIIFPETHFCFCRMDIYINFLRWNCQEKCKVT